MKTFCIDSVRNTICQGVEGAYSSKAARYFAPNVQPDFALSFQDVFAAVKGGVYGVVPVENSTAGEVGEVQDLLLSHPLYIAAAYKLPIRHALLAPAGDTPVTTAYSHPQAISQCANYLSKNRIEARACANTAMAAKIVQELNDPAVGAICDADNAALYGLTLKAENINNYPRNHTKFLLLSDALTVPCQGGAVSIVFSISNRAGSLAEVLDIFRDFGVSLSKIQSRPQPDCEWEYVFHVDFSGNLKDSQTAALLALLRNTLPMVKILGNYHYL